MAGKRKLTQDEGAQDDAPISQPLDMGEVPHPWPPVAPVEPDEAVSTPAPSYPIAVSWHYEAGRLVLEINERVDVKMATGELRLKVMGWEIISKDFDEDAVIDALVYDQYRELWRIIANADGVRFIPA